MSQVPEESFTKATFRQTFKKRFEFTNVTEYGSDADGTHFYWDDARGERHFGVISDLIDFKIVRAGSLSVSIASGAMSASWTDTISPTLPGALNDYMLIATVRTGNAVGGRATLNNATTVAGIILRVGSFSVTSEISGSTDSAQAGVGDPGHAHGLTDSVAVVTSTVGIGGVVNATVDWAIVLTGPRT